MNGELQGLTDLVERLKARNLLVLAVTARYEPSTHFITRLVVPDDQMELRADKFVELSAGTLLMGPECVNDRHYILDGHDSMMLHGLADQHGWSVFLSVMVPLPGEKSKLSSAFFYSSLGEKTPSRTHVRCDLARELFVEWSNMRHASQLVWQEPQTV